MKVFLFFFSVVCVYSPVVYGQNGQSGLRGHPARAGESPVSGSTANLLSHPAAVEASEFIAPGTGFHLIDAFVVEDSILVDGEEIWPMLPQSYGILLDAGRGVVMAQDWNFYAVVLLYSLEGESRIIARERPDSKYAFELGILGFSQGILILRADDYVERRSILIRITGDWGEGIEAPKVIPSADLNQDGKINSKDLLRFQGWWHRQGM